MEEGGRTGAKTETVSVGSCSKELSEIPESLVRAVKGDVSFDFLDLELNKRGVDIAVSRMEIGEDDDGFFLSSMRVQPVSSVSCLISF